MSPELHGRLTLSESSQYLEEQHGKVVSPHTLSVQHRNGRLETKLVLGRLTVTKSELDRYARESAGKRRLRKNTSRGRKKS